jgi:alcohol dehydrogenase (cytochrome c)
MNTYRRSFVVTLVLAAAQASTVKAQQPIEAYGPVTQGRLSDPEPRNWLSYRGNTAGWGFSPLDQIDTGNVADLVPVWTLSTGVTGGHEAPPIVNGGVMFVTTPRNLVLAIDAASGDLLWRYQHPLPEDLVAFHNTNRGVALYGDKVFTATLDARVVALDARTGEVAWNTSVQDNALGYYMTLAPLTAEGLVMVGVSGGELGIRGFVVALDAETGREVWRTHTVPAPGEFGNDSWPGDSWQTGGAAVWLTGHYDPEFGLTYWGTGNPGPWIGDARPGDNLYTNSVIALDVRTGRLRGFHQYHWNGSWDWDEVSTPILMPVQRDGRVIRALVHPGRNGYLWLLKRVRDLAALDVASDAGNLLPNVVHEIREARAIVRRHRASSRTRRIACASNVSTAKTRP